MVHGQNSYPAAPTSQTHEGGRPKRFDRLRKLAGKIGISGSSAHERVESELSPLSRVRESVESLQGLVPSSRLTAHQPRTVRSDSIISRALPDGRAQGVTGVILAGDSAYAVVNTAGESISIVELPFGAHSDPSGDRTGRVLETVKLADLDRPRMVAGREAVKPWRGIALGCKPGPGIDIAAPSDDLISRTHLRFSVSSDGRVGVTDVGSTNGTCLVDNNAITAAKNLKSRGQESPELNPVMDLCWELARNPEGWAVPQRDEGRVPTSHVRVIRPDAAVS